MPKKKANTGLGKIYYSVLDEKNEYGPVKEAGDLIEVTNKHSMSTSSANAADKTYLQTTEYGGTDVTFSLYNIADEAYCDLYGHKMGTKGEIIKSSTDVVPYVALMFEQHSRTESAEVTDYTTLFKGQCQEPEVKGKSKEKGKTEFQSKQISGTFQDLDDGKYCSTVSSDSADFDAKAWAEIWGKTVPIPAVKTASTTTKTEETTTAK
jgi:phi13 family phage major tail protein